MNELELLVGKLADASNKEIKLEIISEIGELGNGKKIASSILLNFLERDEDNEVKSYAANALSKIGGRFVTNQLIRFLKHNSWVTRMKAVETLGARRSVKAIYPIIYLLKNDSVPSVREWAAISLGKIGKKKATKALTTCLLSDPKWEIRMESAYALGHINDKRAKKFLLQAFQSDDDYQVRWAAASSLGKIDEDNAQTVLSDLSEKLLKIIKTEKDENILGAAARTLGDIGNEIAAKTLYKTMKVSKEMVRLEINLALDRMAKRFNYENKEEFVKKIHL
ncbi:MAG: HEAT repeat domain-containing protein [Candidatus Heimdallarchaeota archaeon]|nr:HEAT repeat domain-containing protein [Candidatus Heimdallarchaeota archaeon]